MVDSVQASVSDVPRGQPVVDRLVTLLDLERIEDDIFRGVSPLEPSVRIFGGQVAGQALVAAGRTVPPERGVHSLHANFIGPVIRGCRLSRHGPDSRRAVVHYSASSGDPERQGDLFAVCVVPATGAGPSPRI